MVSVLALFSMDKFGKNGYRIFKTRCLTHNKLCSGPLQYHNSNLNCCCMVMIVIGNCVNGLSWYACLHVHNVYTLKLALLRNAHGLFLCAVNERLYYFLHWY